MEKYYVKVGDSFLTKTAESERYILEPTKLNKVEQKFNFDEAQKLAEKFSGVVEAVLTESSTNKNMLLKKIFNKEIVLTENMLKGTVYYAKRNNFTIEQLLKQPTWRVILILENLVVDDEDLTLFIKWSQMPFKAYDETFICVKRFRSKYGSIRAYRYLLTLNNAIELYLNTRE